MSAPPLPTALLLRLTKQQQKIVQASASIDPLAVLLLARVVSPAEVEAAGGKEVLLEAIREYYASFLTPAKLLPQPADEVMEELRALAPSAIYAIGQMLSGERRVEKTLLETAKYIVEVSTKGQQDQTVDPAVGQMAEILRLVPG